MGFRIQLACFLADDTFKHICIFVLSVCLVHKRPARRAQVMCRVPVLVLDPKISMMLDKQLCNVFSFTNSSIVECRLPFIVLSIQICICICKNLDSTKMATINSPVQRTSTFGISHVDLNTSCQKLHYVISRSFPC